MLIKAYLIIIILTQTFVRFLKFGSETFLSILD